jgi:hypothetical protein
MARLSNPQLLEIIAALELKQRVEPTLEGRLALEKLRRLLALREVSPYGALIRA